jgi:hypothetical protein
MAGLQHPQRRRGIRHGHAAELHPDPPPAPIHRRRPRVIPDVLHPPIVTRFPDRHAWFVLLQVRFAFFAPFGAEADSFYA